MGQVVSIVGPTGSGKTTLINDIELFADGDTPSGRRILIDGAPAPADFRCNPARNPIALITQHTTFLSDMPVRDFLTTHCRVRASNGEAGQMVAEAIEFANQLTGEPIDMDNRMTELSGGQTRALLIADATVICSTPVVLAGRSGERRHPPHAGRAIAPAAPQDLHFRHARSADRLAVRLPHRDAGRLDRQRAFDQRRGAGRVVRVNRLDDALSSLARQAAARTCG